MRKPTDPGMPAPPAPGSVSPRAPAPAPPPLPRKLSPGAGSYTYTSEDDVPTKPDLAAPSLVPAQPKLLTSGVPTPMFGPPPVPSPVPSGESVQPEFVRLVRLLDSMPPVERRRFLTMADHYGKLPLARRVLLEELARELAGKGT